MERQLAGTVEADELYHTAGQKGQAKQGGKKSLGHRPRGRRKKCEPGRGHYDKDRPAIIAAGQAIAPGMVGRNITRFSHGQHRMRKWFVSLTRSRAYVRRERPYMSHRKSRERNSLEMRFDHASPKPHISH